MDKDIAVEHYYIFYTNKGDNVYERTSSDENRARNRVKELKEIYEDATYFKNDIPKDYKWFY